MDLCKDLRFNEPVLAWLRLGVSKVKLGNWFLLFKLVSNSKLLGLLFLAFCSFGFNGYEILCNVFYMCNVGMQK